MKPSLYIILFVFLILLLSERCVFAQTDLYIEDISSKTDLPSGSINCIEQDESGFIWLGTWKGLFRYDGYSAVNFSQINPAFDAMKVSALHIEGNSLWVGSFFTGIYKINLLDYSFVQFSSSASPEQYIPNNDILSICSLGKRIVAGTERGGFCIIDSLGKIESLYNTDVSPNVVNSQQISKIIPLNEHEVLFYSGNLTSFNVDTKEVHQYLNGQFYPYVTEIEKVGDNHFLVGTSIGFDLVSIIGEKVSVQQILNKRVNTVLKLPGFNSTKYLIGSVDGVMEYDLKTKYIEKIRFNQSEQISNQNITSIKYTYDGAILLGSENGLFSLIQRKQNFHNIGINDKPESPVVVSTMKNVNDDFFVGSWGKGILKLNLENKLLEKVSFTGYSDNQPRFIYSMAERNGKIWFSCKDQHGVFCFDRREKPYRLKFYHFFSDFNGNESKYIVTSIYVSRDNELYLGTWEGLLFYYSESEDRFVLVTDQKGKIPSSLNLAIFSIIEDNENNFWVGINGGGAIKFKINNHKIIEEQVFTDKSGLTSNFVTQIYQTRNNRIWIGSEKGLTIYENGKLEQIFNKDIIFDIQSMTEDPLGFLWIGTQNGLIRVNSNQINEPFKRFDNADGLKNKSFYINAVEKDKNLNFYFGGFDGIDYFTPYNIEYNNNKPTPKIINFSIFNEKIFPISRQNHRIFSVNVQYTKELKLHYNENTFSLEFSNLEYQIPEKCQYAFMLEGVDKEWNYRNSQNRVAYYTKLSPGTYKFKLTSTNHDGVWCKIPIELTVTITPPFWATTWAYIIYFVFVMVSIFIFSYLRIVKVQENHQQQIKELEYEKQKELDELKLKFFTNISHEFRTPLTLILGPIARILEKEKNDPFYEKHLMIFRNANRLLYLTNRIMDFRKSEKEQLKLEVEHGNLAEQLKNIFLFFKYEAEKRNINYQFKTELEGDVWFDKEFIESIVFNILSNAFKYTPDGKSISLTLTSDSQWVKLIFADTGKGISSENIKLIFDRFYSTAKSNSAGIGLSFTHKLVELHKGEIDVESTEGVGSTFVVKIPATDVYFEEEKNEPGQREKVIDWESVDMEAKNKIADQIQRMKSLFAKDELIALVVDDNFEIRSYLRSLLEDSFKVLEAQDGETGLELAFEHLPDIVISDVMMPGIDGLELCERLKTDVRTDHIPVILTTVLSSQNNRIEGLSKGADSYIPKPIDPGHLLVRVHKLVEKQLRLREKFNFSEYEQDAATSSAREINSDVHPLIERARKIVLENIDNSDYNIDDFCRDLGLSRMQLYRKFKTITGLSANSFIRKVRLHKAAELIKTGKYSIKEVTYDVGFTDLKYFRKCFFEEFGVNPSEYDE